ncbi:hypothetical protein ACJIZ3_012017 [Penstemon smallii]|uniref:Uncharacterized protein n=1 Tax=Penstemon smallii TaxID=265156 RepID=A0ABD3UPD8_9LAMI
MSTASRRTRRHPTQPPPPSPKVLHFPRSRRTRRKQPKPTTHNNPLLLMHQQQHLSNKEKLENLLIDQGNEYPVVLLDSNSNKCSVFERRERVEEDNNGGGGFEFEEEKWRFQAEILRAECNFLRMEREFALKKLERNRVKMQRTLKSAVQTLVSGKKKIFEGKNVNAVLEEEIEDLAEKLEELQKSSKDKDPEVRNCSNFDKKACLLQRRRLEKIGGLSDQSFVKESNLSINTSHDNDKESSISISKTKNKATDVDVLKKKMEGLSKGMLNRVEEEYGTMLSISANSSVASSASTSKRIDHLHLKQDQMLHEENKCSGRCKVIIRRIVEQVRVETEQWSQMQEMLGQVRGEMEELQSSRDFWENRAHNSDYEIQSLRHQVEEWKGKALNHEIKANELQLELSKLKEDLQKPKEDLHLVPLGKQLQKEKLALSCRFNERHHFDENGCTFENVMKELNIEKNKERTKSKDLPPISLGKQLAKEKRMFLRGLKENRGKAYSNSDGVGAVNRFPLQDIGNSSSVPLARQNSCSREAFLFDSPPESSRTRESCFRK